MKKYIYSVLVLAATMLAACTGDYTDWADPQQNEQPATVTFGDGSVTEVGLIDFAQVTASEVQVVQLNAPTASDAAYAPEYTITLDGKDYALNADGTMSANDLHQHLVDNFGKAPTERVLLAQVSMWLNNGTTTVKTATSGLFNVSAKLDAPEIYDHLYLIGGITGTSWDTSATSMPFTHSDTNVYDDPVFTIQFAVEDGEYWFAFTDDKTVSTGDWSNVFGAKEGNGNNNIGETGLIDRRSALADDGSFKVVVNGDAKAIKVTVNMLEGTYLIEKIAFAPYIYFIGATDGWSVADQKLATTAFDGKYTGYLYVADPNGWGLDFKFQRVSGSWDNEINSGTFAGGITGDAADDGGNIKVTAGAGVYYMEADLVANTLYAVKINNMNLVGDFNGWNQADDAQQMTWDAENYCYVIRGAQVTANGWKFTANNAWTINLGGAADNLVANGDNISATGSVIKLYPTRKTSDNIYYTIE